MRVWRPCASALNATLTPLLPVVTLPQAPPLTTSDSVSDPVGWPLPEYSRISRKRERALCHLLGLPQFLLFCVSEHSIVWMFQSVQLDPRGGTGGPFSVSAQYARRCH